MAHTHSPHARPGRPARALAQAAAAVLAFGAVEALGGWWAGSLALLGDAGHMVTDASALAIAWLAAWIAQRPPSGRHSYGFGRAEVVAAVVNALFMLAIVAAIVTAAIERLAAPRPVAGGWVMGIAALGLAVNLAIAVRLGKLEPDLNLRAALLHVLADLLGSVAALLAGAVVWWTGWTPIDPILSLLICALILYSSLQLLREALHVVMEAVPKHLDLDEVGRAMAAVGGVHSVHDLHIWTLSSGRVALSAHVLVEDITHWPALLRELRHVLEQGFGIDHVTLQPEATTEPLLPADPAARPIPGGPGATHH